MAMFNSYSSPGTGVRSLITPVLDFSPTGTKRITFWMYRDNGYSSDADKIEIYTNTSANLTGATLLGTINRSRSLAPTVGSDGWYEYFYDVTTTSATTYVIFKAIGAYGNNMYVDDIKVEAPPSPCSGTPTAGTISTANQYLCSGATVPNLVNTGFSSGVTGITFQWEQSTDDATWTTVVGGSGATTATYSTPVFAGATNTPIASTLVGIELFGLENGIFLALACFFAYLFPGKWVFTIHSSFTVQKDSILIIIVRINKELNNTSKPQTCRLTQNMISKKGNLIEKMIAN
jgi:hypothetical protein